MDFLRNKILIPLNDLRNGEKRLHFLKGMGNILGNTAEGIQKYQFDRLKEIITYSYNNSAYYRNKFDKSNISPDALKSPGDLIKFPFLEKDDIRNNLSSLLSRQVGKDNLVDIATGGTTSSPVPSFIDKEGLAKKRAATLFFFNWFDYQLGDKVAYLWGAEQDFPSVTSFKKSIRNFLIDRTLFLQTSYLNDKVMWGHYKKLAGFKPKLLQAYPTPLFLFACFLEKNNLKLDIKNINVTAEYLYDYQREKIERIFRTKIFNWYGARELGHIATECCEHHGMHINIGGVFIEIIKNGNQVTDEEGEIVATDLINKAVPLIRYHIGDIGKLSNRTCNCGSAIPLLESVGGRYTDTFKKRDGSFIPGVAFTNRIIKECRGIQELQIIQKDYGLFHLNIVKGKQYTDNNLEDLECKISSFMHDNTIEFKIDFIDQITPEKSGKVRFCKSEIK